MENERVMSPEWTEVPMDDDNNKTSSCEDEYKPTKNSRQGQKCGKQIIFFLTLAGLGLTSFALSRLCYAHTDGGDFDSQSSVNHRNKRQAGTCQVDMCLTQECVHVASSILSSMDTSVDPCEDFFQYTCGNWIKENRHKTGVDDLFYAINHNSLPEKTDLVLNELLKQNLPLVDGVLETKPYQNLFAFHESCMMVGEVQDEDFVEAMDLLKGLETFHLGRQFDPDTWNLTKALLELMRINGAPLVDILIQTDAHQPDQYAIDITPPRRYGLIPALIGPRIRNPGIEEFLRLKGRRAIFGDLSKDPIMKQILTALHQSTPVHKKQPKRSSGRSGSLFNNLSGPLSSLVGKPTFNVLPTDDVLEKSVTGTSTFPPTGKSSTKPATTTEATGIDQEKAADDTKKRLEEATNAIKGDLDEVSVTVSFDESAIESFDTSLGPSSTTTTTTNPSITIPSSTSSSTSSASSEVPSSSTHSGTSPSVNSTEDLAGVTELGPLPAEATEINEYEETDEDYGDNPQRTVSRKTIFKLFKRNLDKKRTEEIATMMQSSLSNITEEDWASSFGHYQPEDIFSAVVDHFVPLLDEIQPTKQEDIRVQQHALMYNHFTVDELQEMAPVIEWRYLLSELFVMNITSEDRIYVSHPTYLVQLNHLLTALDLWVVHYGLVALYAYDILRELIVSPTEMDREDFCLQATKNVFGDVMSHMYLHHVGSKRISDIRKHSLTIIENLKEEARDSINEASWLSPKDKTEALKKVDGLHAEVGALDRHWDLSYVNESHIGFTLNAKDSFLQNVMVIYRAFRQELYSVYHDAVDRDTLIWSFTVQPFVVNAFHMQSTNTIVFPEAFFQKPYYVPKAPEYVNYGSAGTSIAHEIFHGLDFTGTLFDHKGVLSKPFTNETRQHLKGTVDCYHKLLSDSFYEEIPLVGAVIAMEIDSTTTLNENLADIGGIKHAFHAYKRWESKNYKEPRLPAINLDPYQLFFISAVRPFCAIIPNLAKIFLMEMDEHLPNGMRMNAMLMNTPEFAEVFNCRPDSRMVKNETCPMF